MSAPNETQQEAAGCLITLGLLAVFIGAVSALGAIGSLIVGGAFLIVGVVLAMALTR